MYCKQCGKMHSADQLYCLDDGYPLQMAGDADDVQSVESNLCPACGTESDDAAAMYCAACGSSFDTYDKVGPAPKTPFNLALGWKVLPGFLVSVALLFVISQLVVVYVFQMKQSINYIQTQLPIDQTVQESLNFLDASLFANLTGISLTLENDDFAQQISYFSTGLAFMAVIAVIALAVGGYVMKQLHPKVEAWKAAIVFAFGYAAVLGIISQFSGISHVISSTHYETSLSFYSVGAVINGLILGFIFSYAGMSLWEKRHRKAVRLLDGERGFRHGIFTVMAAYLVMLVVTVFLQVQYDSNLEAKPVAGPESQSSSAYYQVSFAGKMASYVTQLATGNTIVMKRPGPAPKTYNLLSEVSQEDKSAIGFLIPSDFLDSYEMYVMIVLALFFVAAGIWLAKGHNRSLRLLVVYSLTVAVMITFFAFYTSMNQVFQSTENFRPLLGDESVFIGFRLVPTFIITLLYAGVTASIGFLIRIIMRLKGGVR